MLDDLLFLILLAILSTGLGGIAWRVLAGLWPGGWQWPALAMPMGLGLAGLVLGVAASVGQFYLGLAGLLVISFLATCISLGKRWREIKAAITAFDRPQVSQPGYFIWIFLLLAAWLGLHAPVTDGDALCYHLEVAKRVAQSGRVSFDPDLHETAYPLLVESLQAAALLMRGPVATRSISFLFGLALSASAVMLARPLVSPRDAIWAGVILLSVPIVNCGMIAPLNDVPLAALCASALVALGDEQLNKNRRILISGILCGLACGVKFPGIVWSAVLGLVVCVQSFMESRNTKRRQISVLALPLLFGSVFLVSGGFWYARSAVLTGNPVHPYFKNTFGGHGLDEVLEDARKTPLQHALNIATAPVGLALAPRLYDNFSHQFGPIFLALVPLGFLSRKPLHWYLLVGLGWLEMALCLTQRQSPRFYIATLAPWSAAAAAVGVQMCQGPIKSEWNRQRCLLALTCGALIALNVSFNLARVRHSAAILAGLISPSEFLEKQEPTAMLASWVELHLPADARLIGQDHRGFYWPRPFAMEKAHRRRTGLLKNTAGPGDVVQRLRLAGFTHLVMAEPDPVDAVEFDTDLSDSLNSWLAGFKPLLDQTVHEPEGYDRRYRIYDLNASEINKPGMQANESQLKTDDKIQPASFGSAP